MSEYRRRLVDGLLDALLVEVPAVVLVGPRATGKTTTAARRARTILRLDRPGEAEALRADPDAVLRGLDEPVLIDEWQVVPEVLGAVKRAVDAEPTAGRFLVTGSARGDLDAPGWPGTGRLVRIAVYGMTVAEQLGLTARTAFLDVVADEGGFRLPADVPDLRGYVELALASGFPQPALRLTADARAAWLESYSEQLVVRDAIELEEGRDPVRIRRYLEAYAINSAGVADDKTIFDAARINRGTASAYERLLQNLLVVDSVPAWTSNRLKRLALSPKRYVVDAGLLGAVLRVGVDGVLRDGALLGRVLDTFVASQLRAELQVTRARPRLYHLREEHGRHEVDLVAELGGGRIVAVEVKAGAAPTAGDARHLEWLRDRLGERFVGGVVLHTGPRVFALMDRIVAAPIAALWGPA